MHVVVAGCGRVGAGLAGQLTQQGHTVAVIDRHPDAFRRLPADFAGDALPGVAFDRDVLVRAGVERADAVAAVTNGDNSNIVIARVARETFGVERVVARIYDPRRAEIYQRLGIATVAPSKWTTDQVLRRVLPSQSAVEWSDPTTGLVLVERAVTAALAGTAADHLDIGATARIVAVTRLGTIGLVSPGAVLQEGDLVYVLAEPAALELVDARFGTREGSE